MKKIIECVIKDKKDNITHCFVDDELVPKNDIIKEIDNKLNGIDYETLNGTSVHIYDNNWLRTDRNKIKEDNLDSNECKIESLKLKLGEHVLGDLGDCVEVKTDIKNGIPIYEMKPLKKQ